MKELKPCPFCGGERIAIVCKEDTEPFLYWAVCRKCMKGDNEPSLSKEDAKKAWNTRAERTCENISRRCDIENYNAFECGQCGYKTIWQSRLKFCPGCGAKVVSE